MAREHIRIKSGRGWSARLGCWPPRSRRAESKVLAQPPAKGAGDLATHLALALRSRDKKAQLGGHDVSFGGQPAGHVFALRLPVAGAGDGNA